MYNPVQNYSWGSRTNLSELFGIANPDNLPMAELWMEAHPKSSVSVRCSHIASKTLLPHAAFIQYNEPEAKYGKTVFSQ